MPKKIKFNKYQKRAPNYHWRQISGNLFWFNAYVKARYDQVLGLIPRKKRLKILDIGCGDGVLLGLIGRGQLYGVDTDQDSLGYAASRVKAKVVRAAAEKLPFKNSFFDVVIATEIIEHLPQPEKLLLESRRVLRPGGKLIVSTPVKQLQGLTDKLHVQEFSSQQLNQLGCRYFSTTKIITSHPVWLKNFYSCHWGKISRYQLDIGRWLINALVLVTGWNPFINLPGKPSQQLAVCRK